MKILCILFKSWDNSHRVTVPTYTWLTFESPAVSLLGPRILDSGRGGGMLGFLSGSIPPITIFPVDMPGRRTKRELQRESLVVEDLVVRGGKNRLGRGRE